MYKKITILIMFILCMGVIYTSYHKNMQPQNLTSKVYMEFDVQSLSNQNTVKDIQQFLDAFKLNYKISSSDHLISVQITTKPNQFFIDSVYRRTTESLSLSFRDTNDNLLLATKDFKKGSAKLSQNNANFRVILSVKDANQLEQITKKIASFPPPENKLVIWLDYAPSDHYKQEKNKPDHTYIAAPIVASPIHSQDITIAGGLSKQEAQRFVDFINFATLTENIKIMNPEIISKEIYHSGILN